MSLVGRVLINVFNHTVHVSLIVHIGYPATYLRACVTHAEGSGEDVGSESSYQKGGDDDMQLLEQDMCDDHHATMDLVKMTAVTP
ncbi:hypothetical protein M404DRAFT_23365 [Pisolithus tinctorius Marx 270]|uniref:Uncharacterized protein n=1 Tax=Pisolithus tinctorius Marx 270 TaxID=870435 RepID=A0A0C3PIZ2_PISTI|nr:hypothetical protein M404DRAFT_23365 [Pisolithus tinctorius Marx 270]